MNADDIRRLRREPATAAAWLREPSLREVWKNPSPSTARVLLSIYSRPDHFDLAPELRHMLQHELTRVGYPVVSGPPSSRAERLDWLRSMREENVLEKDVVLERLLSRAGREDAEVLIGVIDTGLNPYLPQLQGKLAPEGESNGEQVHGRDFSGAGNVFGSQLDDANHGNHVTGVATKGSHRIKSAFCRISFEKGDATPPVSQQVVDSIEHLASKGARVINISFHVSASHVAPIAEAMKRHPEILFVVSAANNNKGGEDLAEVVGSDPNQLLATCDVPNKVVVASVTPEGERAHSSNYGKSHVTHAMRGKQVLSFGRGEELMFDSGTSMATPHVTHAVANMLLFVPELGVSEQIELLNASVERDDTWESLVQSEGIVSLRRSQELAALVQVMRAGTAGPEAARKLGISKGAAELVELASRHS